jgi:hypothetical protein
VVAAGGEQPDGDLKDLFATRAAPLRHRGGHNLLGGHS